MAEGKIKTVVLGIGNTLLGDEGIGVHAARKLKNQKLPPSVLVIDGSTAGFKLLALFEKYKGCRFIIIDALKAGPDRKIGQVYQIPLEDFYNLSQSDYPGDEFISFHQTAVADVLNLFYLTGRVKIRGYFIGINVFNTEDETLSFSMELSKEAEGSMDKIVRTVNKLL
ncbi:MAG: hydrogenase maturation protease [Actinomycetota bacterium]